MPVPSRMRAVLRSGLGQEHEGRRQAALVLVKMVLRDPGRVEAATLGMHDLREGQTVALGRVRPIEQAGEKAQADRRPFCCHRRNLLPFPAVLGGPSRLRPIGSVSPAAGRGHHYPGWELQSGIAWARRPVILTPACKPCPPEAGEAAGM